MKSVPECLAVVNCGQLVTLAGPPRPRIRNELSDLSIVEKGALLVRDGLIEATGTEDELKKRITPEYQVLDAHRRVVLPGFVDAHTHPVFAGTRVEEYELRASGATYKQIAEAGGGIRSTVQKTRAVLEHELFENSQRYAEWFLQAGTTTVEAKSGYGLTLDDELKILRVIRRLDYISTFLGAHEVPDEFRGNTAGYVDLIVNEMLPAVRKNGLADWCDVFCEPNVFDVSSSRRILERARNLGFRLRVHADQLSRSGGAELAAEVGAATADHLEHIDDRGIAALVAANVQPVLLPASVYCLGLAKFAPARKMIEAGLALVLATDFNPGSSPAPSISFVLSLASTHMGMSPSEAITSATINAAYSLGSGSQVGSLEPGKRANFVVHDSRDYREIAYFVGIESADAVFVNGQLAWSRKPVAQ